jgi:hypothetical protein
MVGGRGWQPPFPQLAPQLLGKSGNLHSGGRRSLAADLKVVAPGHSPRALPRYHGPARWPMATAIARGPAERGGGGSDQQTDPMRRSPRARTKDGHQAATWSGNSESSDQRLRQALCRPPHRALLAGAPNWLTTAMLRRFQTPLQPPPNDLICRPTGHVLPRRWAAEQGPIGPSKARSADLVCVDEAVNAAPRRAV